MAHHPTRKSVCPPCLETVAWFVNAVRPALKEVADSRLSTFHLLDNAAEWLPAADRAAWRDLVRRLKTTVKQALGIRGIRRWVARRPENRFLHKLFRQLHGDLNSQWFNARGLLLYPYMEPQVPTIPPPRIWECAAVGLAGILAIWIYPFADGSIPAYIVRHIMPYPPPSGRSPCYYDPISRMVVIDNGYISKTVYEIKVGAKADELLQEYLILTNRWDRGAPRIEKEYCQWLDEHYPKVEDLRNSYLLRVLGEELRHGMDAFRTGPFLSAKQHDRQLGESLLAGTGRLRQLFWAPAQAAQGEAFLRDQPLDLGEVFSELSAQMTAAFPQPGVVLMEWWSKLAALANYSSDPPHQRFLLSRYPEHTAAGILGTILLGERLSEGPLLSGLALQEPDFNALANLLHQLLNHPAPKLRLAMQTIYQQEFNHPIDELPFPEILPNGELWDRLTREAAASATASKVCSEPEA